MYSTRIKKLRHNWQKLLVKSVITASLRKRRIKKIYIVFVFFLKNWMKYGGVNQSILHEFITNIEEIHSLYTIMEK